MADEQKPSTTIAGVQREGAGHDRVMLAGGVVLGILGAAYVNVGRDRLEDIDNLLVNAEVTGTYITEQTHKAGTELVGGGMACGAGLLAVVLGAGALINRGIKSQGRSR